LARVNWEFPTSVVEKHLFLRTTSSIFDVYTGSE